MQISKTRSNTSAQHALGHMVLNSWTTNRYCAEKLQNVCWWWHHSLSGHVKRRFFLWKHLR